MSQGITPDDTGERLEPQPWVKVRRQVAPAGTRSPYGQQMTDVADALAELRRATEAGEKLPS